MFPQYSSKLFQKNFRKIEISENNNSSEIVANNSFSNASLISVQEELMAENSFQKLIFENNRTIFLIPLFGTCTVNSQEVNTNQVYIFSNANLVIENKGNSTCQFLLFQFNEINTNDTLLTIENKASRTILLNHEKIKLSLFFMQEREEIDYDLDSSKTFFGYVIHGVFETQKRLIEMQDGLALWDINTVEIEALLPNSVMIAVEF